MIKFNLLSLSFAAVLVTISLGSTQAYIEVIPERNQNDDGYVAPPVPAPSVTSAPVPSVTSAPVPSVTSAPVPSVTSAPVPSVSPAPTSDPCTSNEDGSFGNTSGDVIEIKYDYEMVTVANTDIAYTLSELEKSIADAVLGSSYVTCGINRNLAAGLRRRQLTIIGMNSEPEERITGDDCSHAEVIDDNQCDVVEGRLQLYVDGNAEFHEEEIMNLIKTEMSSSGSLASLNADIIELKYFDGDEPTDNNSGGKGIGNAPGQKKADGNFNSTPLIASGACAAVLLGFFAGKRMMKKDVESESVEDSENPYADQSDDVNDSVFAPVNGSHLNSSGSVTVSSSFAK